MTTKFVTFLRIHLPILLSLWLAGCVTFETSPAALTCDARLPGRWVPVSNSPEEAAKLTRDDYAAVDAQCLATISMSRTTDKPASKGLVQASGFELGGEHFLALGERDLARLLARTDPAASTTPGTSVTLVRYRIDGDLLILNMIDVDTVKKMVEQQQLAATTRDQLSYAVSGDEAQLRAVLLKHPDLFKQGEAPPMRMRRASAEGMP